jgi:hypothetical protein
LANSFIEKENQLLGKIEFWIQKKKRLPNHFPLVSKTKTEINFIGSLPLYDTHGSPILRTSSLSNPKGKDVPWSEPIFKNGRQIPKPIKQPLASGYSLLSFNSVLDPSKKLCHLEDSKM